MTISRAYLVVLSLISGKHSPKLDSATGVVHLPKLVIYFRSTTFFDWFMILWWFSSLQRTSRAYLSYAGLHYPHRGFEIPRPSSNSHWPVPCYGIFFLQCQVLHSKKKTLFQQVSWFLRWSPPVSVHPAMYALILRERNSTGLLGSCSALRLLSGQGTNYRSFISHLILEAATLTKSISHLSFRVGPAQ